ncbi:prenyltransferase [Nesterenkonia sphaerica]|uniref:Prenyltransferase n=1 Tax=Nesterenkonia sphaerica TaxID=1804988 RepID=A0A5R9A7G7_9MICC|nr:prenyltransferase [Nesterenkonia sphaerica]TLP74074.1 prenyltransferase [Nesterenkonia sphaerica]
MLSDLIRSSRPLSWINTAYPFAVAYLLSTGEVGAELIIGTLFFLIPYNLAMYGINDVFDYASDAANPRKGGAEGALLAPSRHRTVLLASAVVCVPFVVALVLLGTWPSWIALGCSLFAVVAYSAPPLRFKEIPGVDSLTSSVHFVSPAVYGLVLAGADIEGATLSLLGAFLLWGMASHAFGAVQDIGPDRAAGIASIATALGARNTVRTVLALWAAAGLLVFGLGWPAAVAGLLVLPYIAAAVPHRHLTDDQAGQAHEGWRHFLWINYAVGAALTMFLIFIFGSA